MHLVFHSIQSGPIVGPFGCTFSIGLQLPTSTLQLPHLTQVSARARFCLLPAVALNFQFAAITCFVNMVNIVDTDK
jgi:hypothetical protein